MIAMPEKIRRWTGPLLGGLAVVLLALLWLSPAERSLGQTVKLVYLHGALVRTAMVLFAVSLPANLVALVGGRDTWLAWGKALTWAAVLVWLVHTLFSIVTTYAAWGVFIAWFEPRTRFTFALALVAVVILAVAWLVGNARFSAFTFILLAGLTLGLAPRLGAVQHPLNAIRLSPSGAIRSFYTAIWLICLAMGGLLALWLRGRLDPDR
ncbi:MAG: hypothetical protein Kow0063_26690 [Anaerolineae bacterium]